MATFKGLLKLKNNAGSFDIIMPKTEAALVTLENGQTVEEQVMTNITNIQVAQAAADAAQAAADAAQAAADAAQSGANSGNEAAAKAQEDATQALADAATAQQAADAAQAAADKAQEDATQALADAATAQQQADKGVKDAATAQQAADAAQAAADKAQEDATQALADAAAAQQQADKAVQNAAAAQQQADKGVEDAATAQQAADAAQAAADAAQESANQGIADAAAALAAAQAAQQAANQGITDAAAALAAAQAAQQAADDAQEDANQGIADAAAALAVANQGVADAAAALAAAQNAQALADENKGRLDAIDENKNKVGGFVTLNDKGLVPAEFIPNEFKEIRIVDNIAARDALAEKFVGLSAYVKDAASGDSTVNKGGAYYIYDGTAWIKTAEVESMDIVLNWDAIEEKPTTLAGYGITDAVNADMIVDAPAANKVLKLDANGKLPADITGNAATANKLAMAVNIGINGGDVVANAVSFDGSQGINIPVVLSNTGVAAGTYTKVTVDAKGRVTAAANLESTDLPEIKWDVITGKPNSAVADIDDAVAKKHEHANKAVIDKVNEADGVMTFDGANMATEAFVDNAVQNVIIASASEPANLQVNGLWIEIEE